MKRLFCLLFLSGCVHVPELSIQDICVKHGYEVGTHEMLDCELKIRSSYQSQQAADAANSAGDLLRTQNVINALRLLEGRY